MNIVFFESISGQKIGVPVNKICGFLSLDKKNTINCYSSTGADEGEDANGWYVKEEFDEVVAILEAAVEI